MLCPRVSYSVSFIQFSKYKIGTIIVYTYIYIYGNKKNLKSKN